VASISDEVAALRGSRPATIRDLLRNKGFARLLAAMVVSSLGDWLGFIAVTSIVVSLGGDVASSGVAVAGVMIARTLPAFVFGPIAGVFVDRLDRKQLMIAADLGRGALYVSMAFLHHLWAIYLLSFVIECLSLLWTPARDASLPNFVPRRQLTNANSLVVVSSYATLPIGGILFATLTGVAGLLGAHVPVIGNNPASLALVVDASTFLFSAAMVYGIDLRSSRPETEGKLDMTKVLRDTRDGIRFVREDSVAAAITGGLVIAFAGIGAVLAIMPIYVQSTLRGAESGWGLVVTAFGVGLALGLASSNAAARLLDRDRAAIWSLFAAGAMLVLLATMPNLSWVVALAVWLGAFCGLAYVSGYTLLQENVVDEYRGRTFAALTTLSRVVLFMSLIVFPTLSSVLGSIAERLGLTGLYVGGQHIDLSGTRLALWAAGALLIGASLNMRRLFARYRLSRPVPLTLVPKLKRPPATGSFIAFEGVEGAGKGTQIAMVEQYLRDAGVPVLVTREPGGTQIGERIRAVLLDPETGTVDARAEAMLFAAARAQTVATVIRPALAEGKVVLCDRYVDSSLAYQGSARGLGEQDVLSLNVWGTQGLFPDLVILLHIEPDVGLARSDGDRDRMEREGEAFLAKVADAYLRIAEDHPERFVVVDAAREPAAVFDDVRQAVDRALRERQETHLRQTD
jgi:dTMP kinase